MLRAIDLHYISKKHNQVGIADSGGLVPLLRILDSRNGSLQHNVAFALYGLADNKVVFILRLQGSTLVQ